MNLFIGELYQEITFLYTYVTIAGHHMVTNDGFYIDHTILKNPLVDTSNISLTAVVCNFFVVLIVNKWNINKKSVH
jgi:hypothetical protein